MKMTSRCWWTVTGLLATAQLAGATLTNYWPLNETTGTSAGNSAPGGVTAELFPGASWVTDPVRGQVLGFDGADGYATAGVLPGLGLTDSFTWSFWANSVMGPNNNIMVGNRYPDSGWVKFTTAAFEYRDLAATFNESLDYADFATNSWFHHAVVKNGQLFTYYRNGVAQRNTWTTGVLPSDTPMYFGGDTTNENWSGRLDEVATWTNALPSTSIAGIFGNKFTPATAPFAETVPALVPVLVDDFSGELFDNWNPTTRGLESMADGGYNLPEIVGGALTLGGTTNAQYWLGSSVESLASFDSRIYSEVSVKRTSLAGSGTAYRSSVWILGDNTHYLHLSQNVGEGGWSYNARDAGGAGEFNPTGGGNNLKGLDSIDADGGAHEIKFRILPTGVTGSVNIEMQIDGVAHAVHGFTNFPQSYTVVLTGQGRAINDTVTAVFDDVRVSQQDTDNEVPVFTPPAFLPTAAVGTAYSANLADFASDPEAGALTFTKVSGPTWITIAPNGALSGTPDANASSTAQLVVRVADTNGGEVTGPVLFRVTNPAAPQPPFFGWWPLNDGAGNFGADISGGGNRANINNTATGGLAEDGSVWFTDPEFGKVISFNGADGATTAGWAVIGNPPAGGTLPVMDLAKTFTWSFWAKSNQSPSNDIILGNRYNAAGAEFAPAQFTKFTGFNFEWYLNGTAEHVNYEDIIGEEVWTHHLVVKDGNTLFYYRNGVLSAGRTITLGFTEAMPIFLGGGANGAEAWSGYLHDVRLFNGALNEPQVTATFNSRGVFAAVSPTFTASVDTLATASAGAPFSVNIAPRASDPQNDALVFSKVSGPDWVSVSPAGVISGTPDALTSTASVVVRVADPSNNSATATFTFRVQDPAEANPPLFGAWPLDDGAGAGARDTSGNGLTANITNAESGGLADNASVWLQDPERGMVLSFEGTDTTGAWASVDGSALPLMNLENSFTWAFWAKPDQGAGNDIILGNRYNAAGVDFAPVQFVKFTSSQFEWYVNGVNQGIDYADLEQGVWMHHVVVKDGNSLFYYRNGVLTGQRLITINPTEALPVYFGGGFNGVENWRGALSRVNLYNGALTEAEIQALASDSGSAESTLRITSVTMAPNRAITLQWNAEAGKTYNISASKTTGGFVKIGESATGTFTFQPGDATFNTATEARLFFRVSEQVAP